MKVNFTHLYGILWFIAHLAISSTNDMLMKYLGLDLGVYQVVFLRFCFSTVTLLPFFFFKKISFKTTRPILHIARGGLLFCGITLWCIGLKSGKIALATTINFTMPIFVLLLARIFLHESITKLKLIATLMGLIGIITALNPASDMFNPYSLSLLVSAFIFATLDVVNKKFIAKEPMINMLFYSSLVTALFSAPGAILQWHAVTIPTLCVFLALGIGANLILYCILKSFTLLDASSVAPYRYLELIFSASLGYLVFNELPDNILIAGAAIITLATAIITYESTVKARAKQKSVI